MLITVLKSKIHRCTVTQANINYIGSCEIDKDLLEAANIAEYEQIHLLNVNNGERFITYALASDVPGMISVNGAAARKVAVSDILIICAYGQKSPSEIGHSGNLVYSNEKYKPEVVFVDGRNMIVPEELKDKQTVITAVGFLGDQECYINVLPEEAYMRYAESSGITLEEAKEFTLKEHHIGDEFEVYDISAPDADLMM